MASENGKQAHTRHHPVHFKLMWESILASTASNRRHNECSLNPYLAQIHKACVILSIFGVAAQMC